MAGFTDIDRKYIKPEVKTTGGFDFTECDRLLARDYAQGSEILPVRLIQTSGESASEVKITDGTDTMAVNADGSINITGGGDILKHLYDNGVYKMFFRNAAAADVYTVPNGKKFVVTSLSACNTTSYLSFQIQNSSSTVLYYGSGRGVDNVGGSSIHLVLTASQKINLGHGSVAGYEITA